MTYTLTPEELAIQEEMDTFVLTQGQQLGAGQDDEIMMLTKAAQDQYKKMKKTKQITIRISEKDLIGVKAKAIKLGIPYQTLIGSHIHQLATA